MLFSAGAFRPVLRQGFSEKLDRIVHDLRPALGLSTDSTNGDVVQEAYRLLAHSYRAEYVYKNLIASKVFVGRHRAANSIMINEFHVGDAIADAVFLNGAATVYEIKTELDNPDKLEHQLAEYYKAFPLVNVVVHESACERYEKLLDGSPAGIIVVGKRWRLSTRRMAREHFGDLVTRTMVNSLRVAEIEDALRSLGIEVPNVPNGLRYGCYLEIAQRFSAREFHEAFRRGLKSRGRRADANLYREPALFPLRSLLVQLDPSRSEGEKLLKWLSTKGY